jgi:hypothetical protein
VLNSSIMSESESFPNETVGLICVFKLLNVFEVCSVVTVL